MSLNTQLAGEASIGDEKLLGKIFDAVIVYGLLRRCSMNFTESFLVGKDRRQVDRTDRISGDLNRDLNRSTHEF
jgi:hypothetical protein